jgi:Ca2+/Na+ antiporter
MIMVEIIFENITIFPEWAQHAILTSWGIFLFIVPIVGIVKILQSNSSKTIYRYIPRAFKNIGNFLQHQIDDPIKYPKVEKVLQYVMVVQSYILSLWLFLYFILLTLLWGLTDKELTIAQHVGVIFFCLICVYMSAVLKTQGNRELLKIRAAKST